MEGGGGPGPAHPHRGPCPLPAVLDADGPDPAAAGVRGPAHPLADGGALRHLGRDGAARAGEAVGGPGRCARALPRGCRGAGGLGAQLERGPFAGGAGGQRPRPGPGRVGWGWTTGGSGLWAEAERGGVERGWGRARGGRTWRAASPTCTFLWAQIRASRLEQIDQELLSAQDRVQQTEPQVLGGVATGLGSGEAPRAPARVPGWARSPHPHRHGRSVGCTPAEPSHLALSAQALLAAKSVPVDEDPDTEVPTHPEDGVPQPGNSKVRGHPGLWGPGGWAERCGGASGVEVHGEWVLRVCRMRGPSLLHLPSVPRGGRVGRASMWSGAL